MRNKLQKKILQTIVFICICLANINFLFAEGKPATELAKKVKTEGLSGLNLFLATQYNDNRLVYALVSTFSIMILGIIVTYIIGIILKPHPHIERNE